MSAFTHRTPDSVDEEAHTLARQHADGILSEEEARSGLARLVVASGVPRAVSREPLQRDGNDQMNQDVAVELRELLARKVVGEPGSPPTFRLDLIASGSSFSGGMRGLCRKAVAGKMRDMHNRAQRYRPVLTPILDEDVDAEAGSPAPSRAVLGGVSSRRVVQEFSASVYDPDADADTDVLEVFQYRTHTASGTDRVLAEGQALARMLRVPDPDRDTLTSPVARARLRDWLCTDRGEVAVGDVLEGMLAGRVPRRGRTGQITGMLAGYTDEDLQALTQRPLCVAHRMLVAAASPTPPPRRRHVRQVNTMASECLGGAPRVAARLVRLWADSVTELDGSEYTRIGAKRYGTLLPKSDEQMAEDIALFEAEAARVIATGRTGLGERVEEVAVLLAGFLEDARSGVGEDRAA